VAGRTIRAEIDDTIAAALDELVGREGRSRSRAVTAAVKVLLEFSPAARQGAGAGEHGLNMEALLSPTAIAEDDDRCLEPDALVLPVSLL
jgi:hypothetical protein